MPQKITLGACVSTKNPVQMDLSMVNRHGIIAGATGTGKTVTLQILAEQFSKQGIPVFTADAKGDLSGIAFGGKPHKKIDERNEFIGIKDYTQKGCPTVFWDLFGERGHPVRTTVLDMGPLLLSRLLGLSDTQDAVLHMLFKIADDQNLLLLDLKDLKAMLRFVSEDANDDLEKEYGKMSSSSISAIVRQVMVLESAGGDKFFGEKAFDLQNLLKKDFSGNGIINILDAKKLMIDNRMYSTFLLWLLSELFEKLPEVGESDKPKLVFFFDEAHLLFADAPKALVQKIEQVVRLIRSKGVGIYFVTQNPLDIPETIRGQLGNRIQHALRAFTPKEQKAAKSASETFRQNPDFDVEEIIGEMEVGFGLVSTLDEKGRPSTVQHTMIRPPESRMGTITEEERTEKIKNSPLYGIYEEVIDRESAFEILQKQEEKNSSVGAKNLSPNNNEYYQKYSKTEQKRMKRKHEKDNERGGILDLLKGTGKRQGYIETFGKQILRSVGSRLVTSIVRGILGGKK